MSRPARIAAIAAATLSVLVVVLAAVMAWAGPWLIESQVRSLAAGELGLEASFEDVSVSPFALRLEARGFAMGRPGEEPVASLAELVVDLDAMRLFAGRVIVTELELVAPEVTLEIPAEGRIRIAGVPVGGGNDAVPEAGVEDSAEDGAEDSETSGLAPIAQLRISALRVRDGRFRIRDHSRDPAFDREIAPISLAISRLDLTDLLRDLHDSETSPTELKLGFGDGAQLQLSGGLDVEPLTIDLRLELEAVPLAILDPYLASLSSLRVRSGVLSGSGQLQVGGAAGGVDFAADARVDGLALGLAGEDEPAIAWKRLEVKGFEAKDVEDAPASLKIESIALEQPALRLVNEVDGLRLAAAFASEAGSDPAPDEPGPSIEVGGVTVSEGHLRFEDRAIEPPYRVDLTRLRLTAGHFRNSPESRSKLEIAAQVDGYAPLLVSGSLSPLAPREFLDLFLIAEGFKLKPFSPYTGRYLGREIAGGRGLLEVSMKVEATELDSVTQVVLDGLEFGDAVESTDATLLPVVTAAGLAKDSAGRIEFAIPVEGDVDDPGFSYGSVLLDGLGRLVTRIVTIP